MSTVDEVLATAEVVDAVCVIDGETRIISVPNEYKELGVESDENVTRIKFKCPKIVGDNTDLTEYNLYINYRNAGNKLNSYLVEDVTVTDDVINFSWLLSRHVTESPGTISYIVCAKKSDYTGVINEWNTKVATGTVGVGLEATEEIEEQNIDIIEQILKSIVELENKVDGGGSGGSSIAIDETLTKQGKAADAKATGDALHSLSEKITAIPSGKDGKSAYAYAVEGGYTGTEAEFAAKLAQEKYANPNALTFTGAVTGSYDGSAALSVEIPSGGGGTTEKAEKVYTIEENVAMFTIPASDFDPAIYPAVQIVFTVPAGCTTLEVGMTARGQTCKLTGISVTAEKDYHFLFIGMDNLGRKIPLLVGYGGEKGGMTWKEAAWWGYNDGKANGFYLQVSSETPFPAGAMIRVRSV